MKNVKQVEIIGSEIGETQFTVFPHKLSQYRVQGDGRLEEKLDKRDKRDSLIKAMGWKNFEYCDPFFRNLRSVIALRIQLFKCFRSFVSLQCHLFTPLLESS